MPDAPAAPAAATANMSRRAAGACIGLLLVFVVLSWSAVATKSPTYDEPLHAVGAWLHLHQGDFRVNPEDPPLWHYWAALPNGRDALRVDLAGSNYRQMLHQHFRQWGFVVHALYGVPGNDADAFIARSRAMMLLLGVGVVAAAGLWARRLAGPAAAIAATAMLALDPNLLAHAPLVKNDVALALVMLGAAWAVWRAGARLTVARALLVGLLCGAALTTKFSGLLLGPIVAVLLVVRALSPAPWPVLRWNLQKRSQRLIAAAGVCTIALVVSVVVVWAAYGFRYLPSRDPQAQLDLKEQLEYAARNETAARLNRPWPPQDQVDKWRPGAFMRGIVFAHEHRLMPQAWLHGLLYTHQSTVARKAYLLGQTSITGWWWYFPAVIGFKAPLALLAAAAGSLVVLVMVMRRGGGGWLAAHGWTAACLGVPPVIYFAAAISSNLNLGMRHILPVLPPVAIGVALAAAWLWEHRRRAAKGIGAVVLIGLAAETLLAYPNYIAFFNAVAGAGHNELRLLSDSNLDWGQDLPALAHWQEQNPRTDLYLAYIGTAVPSHYGISYRGLAGGYYFDADPLDIRSIDQLPRRGVLAVSSTTLQGVYVEPPHQDLYRQIRTSMTPIQVLGGGTIYLYDLGQPRP